MDMKVSVAEVKKRLPELIKAVESEMRHRLEPGARIELATSRLQI